MKTSDDPNSLAQQPSTTKESGFPNLKEKDGIFQCKICDITFTQIEHLRKHSINGYHPTETSIFRCKKCKNDFQSKTTFTAHLKLHLRLDSQKKCFTSPKMNDFKCDPCNKVFKNNQDLVMHQFGNHVKEQICAICSLGFYSESALQYHMQIHESKKKTTKIFLYPCDYCDKTFEKQHLSIKHTTDEHFDQTNDVLKNTKFNCDHCSISYSTIDSIEQH